MSDMSEPPTPVEPPKKNKGGRPKGARNKRDRAAYDAIDKVRALILRDHNIPEWIAVMTPRDIMMHAMARAAAHGMWPLAADIAAKVAPYVHPRLSQVEMNVRDGVKDLTDEEKDWLTGTTSGRVLILGRALNTTIVLPVARSRPWSSRTFSTRPAISREQPTSRDSS